MNKYEIVDRFLSTINFTRSIRCDCPVCGHKHTFSANKEGGKIIYRCFSASCNLRGAKPLKRTKATMQIQLTKQPNKEKPYELPQHFVRGVGTQTAFKWLEQSNSLHTYKNGLYEVAYDPKQNRLVFLIKDKNGTVVGANGRALVKGTKPKWYIYPSSHAEIPFVVGKGRTLVLVEDCASACAAARLSDITGMALLGTNFHSGYVSYLNGYDKIIVALDNDAKRKALKVLKCRLEFIVGKKVSIVFLDKDVKEMSLQELESVL